MNGRKPLFAEQLHVGRPNVGDRDRLLARINSALDRGWLSNDGPLVREFESRIADYLSSEHCIAVTNATIGLQIAISALDLSGEVIVPSFTFPATVHALAWQGIRPVFCDVDPATHNLDPAAAERLISPRTTGILGVHVWGNPCAVRPLTELTGRRHIKLLFDAAHAFGCSSDGEMIGNFGDAEVFSFHATKFLSCGEGGAIVTNSDELARKLRRLRNFGLEGGQDSGIGINGKMSELAAAMGLTSFESRDKFIARNYDNLQVYRQTLAEARGLRLIAPITGERHNYQYVVVEVCEREAGMTRDQIVSALHGQNVLAKKYFFPGCHRLKAYRTSGVAVPLPHTERLCERLLQLPTGMAVEPADIRRIGSFLCELTARPAIAA